MNSHEQNHPKNLAELDDRCRLLKSKANHLWKTVIIVLELYLIALAASWMLGDPGTISSIDIPAELAQLLKGVADSSSGSPDAEFGMAATEILESAHSLPFGRLATYAVPLLLLFSFIEANCRFLSGEPKSALIVALPPIMLAGFLWYGESLLGLGHNISAIEEGRAQDVASQLRSLEKNGKNVDSLQADYLLAQMIARYHGDPEAGDDLREEAKNWYRYNSGIAKRFTDALIARQGQALFEIDPDQLYAIEHFVYGKLHSQVAVDHERNHNRLLEVFNAAEMLMLALLTGLLILGTGILLLRMTFNRRAARIRSLPGNSLEREQEV